MDGTALQGYQSQIARSFQTMQRAGQNLVGIGTLAMNVNAGMPPFKAVNRKFDDFQIFGHLIDIEPTGDNRIPGVGCASIAGCGR